MAPRERAVKSGRERQFADAQADFVMPDGFLGMAIENKMAEVRMGVETTQVGFAKFHEHFHRFMAVARVFEIDRIDDGIRQFVGVGPWQHLLHFEGRALSAGNDRFGPFLDWFILFTPVFLFRVPRAHGLKFQRREAKGAYVQPGGYDLS